MNHDKLFEIRFLVPAILTLVLVFIFSPGWFVTLGRSESLKDIQTLISVLGVLIILCLGFIISSLTHFIVRTVKECGRGLDAGYDKELYKEELSFIKNFLGEKISKEVKEGHDNNSKTFAGQLAGWMMVDISDKHWKGSIKEQIGKRWNFCMANFNCITAILFSLAIIIAIVNTSSLTKEQLLSIWYLKFPPLVGLLLVFLLNGVNAYKQVMSTERLVVAYVGQKISVTEEDRTQKS